jgi:4-hydroxybenzoate polyprenyltransferase
MSASTTAIPSAGRLRTYASFVRFEHTLFSLPLILTGVFTAPGPAMSGARWLLTALAAVGARTAAMSLNRLIDRQMDARNPRTQVRELPAGRMRLAEAIGLLAAALLVYLAACFALGPWYVRVSPVPIAVFAIYPYLKRYTPLCHVGVGASMGLALLAGYAAAHPDLGSPGPALWLFGFALCWGTGFDIIYATLDEDFDRANGVHSMVAWLGRKRAMNVSRALHLGAAAAIAAGVWGVLGRVSTPASGWLVVAGVLFATVLVLLHLEQLWAERVNLAFFKINVWVGFALLAMVLAARMAGGGL